MVCSRYCLAFGILRCSWRITFPNLTSDLLSPARTSLIFPHIMFYLWLFCSLLFYLSFLSLNFLSCFFFSQISGFTIFVCSPCRLAFLLMLFFTSFVFILEFYFSRTHFFTWSSLTFWFHKCFDLRTVADIYWLVSRGVSSGDYIYCTLNKTTRALYKSMSPFTVSSSWRHFLVYDESQSTSPVAYAS